MKVKNAAFIHSPQMEKFSYPPDCPFDVSRAAGTYKILNSMGLLSGAEKKIVPPTEADRVTLKKFHSARYLYLLKEAANGHIENEAYSMGIGTLDCPVFKDMYDYSAWTCGATLTGAELILSGKADVAFNPSGGLHHSGPEKAAGFCYMNDVGLACAVLAEQKKRVLYLDLDVHFGDGVANFFYDRNDVMTMSFHENGRTLFPGTGFEDEIGTGAGKGYCVNVPLPVGTYDQAYLTVFGAIGLPLIKSFNPDIIVLQLGADALSGDPLAHLCLTNNTYADIIDLLLNLNKPILATGGGGYNIENTIRAWALCWTALCGEDNAHDMHLGAGGIMLSSTEWQGGLRDRELLVTKHQQEMVLPAIETIIENIKVKIFPIHGL